MLASRSARHVPYSQLNLPTALPPSPGDEFHPPAARQRGLVVTPPPIKAQAPMRAVIVSSHSAVQPRQPEANRSQDKDVEMVWHHLVRAFVIPDMKKRLAARQKEFEEFRRRQQRHHRQTLFASLMQRVRFSSSVCPEGFLSDPEQDGIALDQLIANMNELSENFTRVDVEPNQMRLLSMQQQRLQ